ncbi:MAG: phosphomannomutase/phosphoglucomutase [Clostridiales bacterium]|nr:phosphomannomutase/phosphoglucomutase [Clostridiales bacterium]
MELTRWMALQNGSDIRGVAMGDQPDLNRETAGAIGRAFGMQLRRATGKLEPLATVGYDSRLTGPALAQALADGLAAEGCRVLMTGLSSTPSMFMTCVDGTLPADGAVMVTASHLPPERNGFKFFTPEGGLASREIRELLQQAAICEPPRQSKAHEVQPCLPAYSAFLRERICAWTGERHPLAGLRILVDAGGGAGGFYASMVLARLGADVEGSLYLEPDGTFAGHLPNPEQEGTLSALAAAVLEREADLGIAFDTDVDRAALVDRDGRILNRNRLIALISAVLAPDHPRGVIVTDSITSTGLARFIEAQGMRHHRFKRGYKNVIDEARRLCDEGRDAPLAIETSGHAAMRENYFLDDGAYLVTRLLAALVAQHRRGERLTSLIEGLQEPAESIERRIRFTTADFAAEGARILDDLRRYVAEQEGLLLEPNNFEGVRVNVSPAAGEGWFMLRMSLHDPVLAVNIESERAGGAAQINDLLIGFLSRYQELLAL